MVVAIEAKKCRMVRRVLEIVILTLVGSGAVSGCERPLFTPNQPRTPYERYQVLRGQGRPSTEENAYGGKEPALRQRLEPLDRL